MPASTSGAPEEEPESRLLKAVEAIAISPRDATAMARKYLERAQKKNPAATLDACMEVAANAIVARYCRLSATSGGVTALSGVVPGLGTVAAALGGGLADAAVCMKLQVDMCMCLAAVFDWDLDTEDARHLAFLIAAGGTLEKAGAEAATQIASKAGVAMLRQYLKGAALQAVKEFFKKIGIIFSRKALEKAIPFGVGVLIGAGGNYALTSYVGAQAVKWFLIDRSNGSSA